MTKSFKAEMDAANKMHLLLDYPLPSVLAPIISDNVWQK